MFCPNCGAKNNDKQNFCRFCGLNLRASAKSLTTQIVHGDNSDTLIKLRAVKRVADFASAILVGALIAGLVADIFLPVDFSKELLIVIVGLFVLIQIVQGTVGYFQRKDENKLATEKFEPNETENLEAKDTAKLLEEKPFEFAVSVTENTTELFPIETKTRKFG